ncbi:cytochrome P450 9e2-like [Sitophilus oryzae]|uniref:Cytochrome P450 9e2-like n=1 Tax=Sitophilus oryzae TaxID=7048 RepID=A0A6J2YIB5_SITOR|nr:cytochrome P450 9e2-like [Sitophilus oryzae]
MDQCSQDPHREFTNAKITTQALVFFIAGFDTVSTALCFATYELAINPIIQSKLRHEINRVWTKTKGNITYYITIDRGQIIWIPVQSIHMNPDYYPDPEKLDPERFSDENKSKLFPYTYLPFSIGPGNCIGMRYVLLEIKILRTVIAPF